MPHPLHEAIAALLEAVTPTQGRLIVDDAANGKQHIPLYLTENICREHRLCCVDAMILVDDQVRLLVEIEESNVKPTQVAGKFLTSALAGHYVHRKEERSIQTLEGISFLQVVSAAKFKKNSKKKAQLALLAEAIQNELPLGSVSRYELFVGKTPDFYQGGSQYSGVSDFVKQALAPTAAVATYELNDAKVQSNEQTRS